MAFSRSTLFEACTFLGRVFGYHGQFEDMVLRWELDNLEERSGSIAERCRNLFRFLRDNPDVEFDGRLIRDLVVEEAASKTYPGDSRGERLVRALERDGYTLDENGQLLRTLPEVYDLPAANDEVYLLLTRHNLSTPQGHLEQAIDSHARGNWAAANGQLRTFYEALFNEIALLVDPVNAPGSQTGEARRQLLANLTPPFLSRDLNEWSDDGKNFVNGTLKRLHPQGAHPGLSDEEDCTFRLHLVLLVARLFLRRLNAILGTQP